MKICVEPDRHYPYLAEFHLEGDGTYRLFSLTTIERHVARDGKEYLGRTGWDVEWIGGYQQYCYHQSSGGGSLRMEVSGIYWRHPDMLHIVREETARYVGIKFRKRNRTRRLRRIPEEILNRDQYEDLMEMLGSEGIDSDTYYCSVCEARLPDREEDYCEHVWWCDTDGMLRGPGSDEGDAALCEDEDCFHCARKRDQAA